MSGEQTKVRTFPEVAALCCVYHDDLWLPYAVESVYDVVGKIYFLVNTRPWFGDTTDNSETIRCIESLPDPQRKLILIRGAWATEGEQRNFSIAYAETQGHTHGLILDADELYEPGELAAMLEWALAQPEVDCFHMEWYTYWKSERYVIDPHEYYHPPFLVRFGEKLLFLHARNPVGGNHTLVPPEVGRCHHMSYARSDALVRRKISSFSHAQEIVPGWFEKVWMAWDHNREMENLHPVTPAQYRRAIEQPVERLPAILRRAVERRGGS